MIERTMKQNNNGNTDNTQYDFVSTNYYYNKTYYNSNSIEKVYCEPTTITLII